MSLWMSYTQFVINTMSVKYLFNYPLIARGVIMKLQLLHVD